jgi:hypothetical protein
MTEKMKLLLALQQIENLTELLNGNEYSQYLYSHLIQLQVELSRQYSNLQNK